MKFAVSSYSFARRMKNEGLTQIDLIKIAKDLCFDAIEFAEILPQNDVSLIDYATLLREESERCDIKISNLAVTANLLGDINEEFERVCVRLDCARVLGVETMRHDVTFGPQKDMKDYFGFASIVDRLGYGCKKITEYAKSLGIKTMVENHGLYFQDIDRIELLLSNVADENFGILADMGNFLCADVIPNEAIGRLMPHIFYVHAKDFYVKNGVLPNPGKGYFKSRGGNFLKPTIVGHGDVPIKQCIDLLKENGYDGYVGLEFEGMEDTTEAITIGIENLKNYLNN